MKLLFYLSLHKQPDDIASRIKRNCFLQIFQKRLTVDIGRITHKTIIFLRRNHWFYKKVRFLVEKSEFS